MTLSVKAVALSAAMTCALVASALPAAAAGGGADDVRAGDQPTNVQIVWGVFLGGVKLGKISIAATLNGEDYSAVSQLETGGVVNAFWESKILADTRGVIRRAMTPFAYNSDTLSERSNQKVNLGYTDGFPAELFADPPYDLARFPVTDAQKRGTLDPLSGIVFAVAGVSVSESDPCGTVIPVFDGRRRYDLELTYVRTTEVSDGDHGYRGPVLECEMEYKQIAGFKPNLDPEKRALPKIYTHLAAVPRVDEPARNVFLPLKIWAETDYGTATAIARHVKVNNVPPARPAGAAADGE